MHTLYKEELMQGVQQKINTANKFKKKIEDIKTKI